MNAIAWCASCQAILVEAKGIPSMFDNEDHLLMNAMHNHIGKHPGHLCAWARQDLAVLLVVKERTNRKTNKKEKYIAVRGVT